MGVKIFQVLPQHSIRIEDLRHRVIVIDGHLVLYQFISSIRGPDGTPLSDSNGNVTSHLQGLFARVVNLLSKDVKIAFVFDGKSPELKKETVKARIELKINAMKKYSCAQEEKDVENMRKYASRTSSVSKEMVAEAIELLDALGVPCIQAPSEGEAQAARIVKDGAAFAVGSQDADVFLFGAPRLVKNLTISERRKVPGRTSYTLVEPERYELAEILSTLEIDQKKLIAMGMLIGTDYNPGGIRGIGPKKALKLVKEHTSFDSLFRSVNWDEHFENSWNVVFDAIENVKTRSDYNLLWRPVDKVRVKKLLCDKHEFSEDRIDVSLERLRKGGQMELGRWG